jgi:predicted RNA methylase
MTSQRVTAMEHDMDRIEQALIMFTKMDSRIAVIETEVKNINKKLDNMKN